MTASQSSEHNCRHRTDSEPGLFATPPTSMRMLWIAVVLVIAIVWAGRYREGPPLAALPTGFDTAGAVVVTDTGAHLGRAGSVNVTFDMQRGRALVLVAARARFLAGWPRLRLTANGDFVKEWRIVSTDTRVYSSLVYVAAAPVRLRLQGVDYYEDSTGDDRSVDVQGITVLQGHTASTFSRRPITPLDFLALTGAATLQTRRK